MKRPRSFATLGRLLCRVLLTTAGFLCLGVLQADDTKTLKIPDGEYRRLDKHIGCAKVRDQVRDLLRRITAAIEDKQWNQMLDHFRTLVEKFPDRVIETSPGHFIGVRDFALAAMSQLPGEAVQAFRLRFDADIELQFKDAVMRQDLLALRRIGFDYALSSHAIPALRMLGDLQLERGYAAEAAEAYEKAVALARVSDADTGAFAPLAARLGQCLALCGEADKLARLRAGESLPDNLLAAKFQLGENNTTLGAFLNALSAAPKTPDATTSLNSFPKRGGTPDNLLWAQTRLNPADHKWTQAVKDQPANFGRIRTAIEPDWNEWNQQETPDNGTTDGGMRLVPSVEGNLVYVHTNDTVQAFNFYTGHQVWKWSTPKPSLYLYRDINLIFSGLIHGDLYIANIERPQEERMMMFSSFYVKPYLPVRDLVAFNRFTGEVVWQVTENTLNKKRVSISFPTAPVSHSGKLYTVATNETGEEITQIALCINPDDGRIEWQLEIGDMVAESNMFGRNIRESMPTQPVMDGNCMYFCMNFGAFVAVDIAGRDIEWIQYYTPRPIPRSMGLEMLWRKQAWANNPVVLWRGLLFFAPLDGNALYCVDAKSGKIVWQKDRYVGETYFIGINPQGQAVTAGEKVWARDAVTGNDIRGEWPLVNANAVGWGYFTDDSVYIPSKRRLLRVGYDGKLISALDWRSPLQAGTLTPLSEAMALCSGQVEETCYISACFDFKTQEKIFVDTLQNSPRDPAAYLELGSLYLQSENYEKALSVLSSAMALETADDSEHEHVWRAIRNQLFTTYLQLGGKDGLKPSDRLAQYTLAQNFAVTPQQTLQLAQAMSDAYITLGQGAEAIAAWDGVHARFPAVEYDFGAGSVPAGLHALLMQASLYETVLADPSKAVQFYQALLQEFHGRTLLDTRVEWMAYAKIDALIAQYPDSYRGVAQQADKLLAAARDNRSLAECETLLRFYPNFSTLNEAIALGSTLAGDKAARLHWSAILNEFIASYPAPENQPPLPAVPAALGALVETYHALAMTPNFNLALLRLSRDFPGQTLSIGGKTATAREHAQTAFANAHDADRQATLSLPRAPLAETAAKQTGDAADLLQLRGTSDLSRFLFVSAMGMLELRDAATGEPVTRIDCPGDKPATVFADSALLLIVCEFSLLLCDLATPGQPQILWSCALEQRIEGADAANGMIVLNLQSQSSKQTTLGAFEWLTGRASWTYPLKEPVFGNPLIASLSVFATGRNSITVIDLLSGTLRDSFLLDNYFCFPARESERRVALFFANAQGKPSRGQVALYDALDNKILWKQPLNYHPSGRSLYAAPGCVLLAPRESKSATLYDADTGKPLWNVNTDRANLEAFEDALILEKSVVLCSESRVPDAERRRRTLYQTAAYDRASGAQLWNTLLQEGTPGSALTLLQTLHDGNTLCAKFMQYKADEDTIQYAFALLDLATGKAQTALTLGVKNRAAVTLGAANERLAILTGKELKLYSGATAKEPTR